MTWVFVNRQLPSSLSQNYTVPTLGCTSSTYRKLQSFAKSDSSGMVTFFCYAVSSVIPFFMRLFRYYSGLQTPMLISSNSGLTFIDLVQAVSNCRTCSLWQYSQMKVLVVQQRHCPFKMSSTLSICLISYTYSGSQFTKASFAWRDMTCAKSSCRLILVIFSGVFLVSQFLSMALHWKVMEEIYRQYSMQLCVSSSNLAKILSFLLARDSTITVYLASLIQRLASSTTKMMSVCWASFFTILFVLGCLADNE